ncbi:MAG: hypothetical protein KGZ34_04490 [Nitrosarchaeum sp.]|nr:hypothetical protein [Nitrosarchaeum sp.]
MAFYEEQYYPIHRGGYESDESGGYKLGGFEKGYKLTQEDKDRLARGKEMKAEFSENVKIPDELLNKKILFYKNKYIKIHDEKPKQKELVKIYNKARKMAINDMYAEYKEKLKMNYDKEFGTSGRKERTRPLADLYNIQKKREKEEYPDDEYIESYIKEEYPDEDYVYKPKKPSKKKNEIIYIDTKHARGEYMTEDELVHLKETIFNILGDRAINIIKNIDNIVDNTSADKMKDTIHKYIKKMLKDDYETNYSIFSHILSKSNVEQGKKLVNNIEYTYSKLPKFYGPKKINI